MANIIRSTGHKVRNILTFRRDNTDDDNNNYSIKNNNNNDSIRRVSRIRRSLHFKDPTSYESKRSSVAIRDSIDPNPHLDNLQSYKSKQTRVKSSIPTIITTEDANVPTVSSSHMLSMRRSVSYQPTNIYHSHNIIHYTHNHNHSHNQSHDRHVENGSIHSHVNGHDHKHNGLASRSSYTLDMPLLNVSTSLTMGSAQSSQNSTISK
ncbi:uncharacterized protein RJT21DRAFT_121228 [Scheffersomyces amazonensis]|uniref:uncharacterized protein n=1 Tax=Scheffersomyces amazonensis TaxID=1078765 RepID=UPI00315CBFC1